MKQVPQQSKKQVFLSFLFWFCLFYVILFFVGQIFDKGESEKPQAGISLQANKDAYVMGSLPVFTIANNTDQDINLPSPCREGSTSLSLAQIGESTPISCSEGAIKDLLILKHSQADIPFAEISNKVFTKPGEFQLIAEVVDANDQTQTLKSQTIEFKNPGIFRQLYRALVTKPLFNTLVFFVGILPGHSLGWAIVLLTILVRILLFVPNQRAMASQRELQRLQPKMNEIKAKYKDNQQMLAMKTMELYKTHKINPMSSCWPILLQMPFLIGLYHIILEGLSPHMEYFLYGVQSDADLTLVENMFLGLNLSVPNVVPLALLVAGAQWVALRMANIRQKKKNEKAGHKPAKKDDSMAGQMQNMSKTMEIIMPAMIGFFTAVMPAGVGLYWLTSTVFGIGQQWLVNHQLEKPVVTRKN